MTDEMIVRAEKNLSRDKKKIKILRTILERGLALLNQGLVVWGDDRSLMGRKGDRGDFKLTNWIYACSSAYAPYCTE